VITALHRSRAVPGVPGTLRSRAPEETWRLVQGCLDRFGITRIADLTGLDVVGVPVYAGIRPGAATVTVSAGKGATPLLARISAAMESIEVAVAETWQPEAVTVATARQLGLPYDVTTLALQRMSIVSDSTTLVWVTARRCRDGRPVPLPATAVGLAGWAADVWSPRRFVTSSNGLASGNDRTEATLHGLLELVERDAVAGIAGLAVEDRTALDLDSVADPVNRSLLDRLTRAGLWCEVVVAPAPPGIHCFVAYLWHRDMPQLFGGSGAHRSPSIALSRALTEAAQSRLSCISGGRDDITADRYLPPVSAGRTPPGRAATAVPFPAVAPDPLSGGDDLDAALRATVETVEALTGQPVLVVDLTPADLPLAVTQVFAPGLRFDAWDELDRRSSLTSRSAS
jgi:ribosomal protein S12 methylthiotransferase accessory factor